MDILKRNLCDDIARILQVDKDIVYTNTDTTLFSPPYNANAEELVYIYFYLKRNYEVILDVDKVKEGAFNNIDGIRELVK